MPVYLKRLAAPFLLLCGATPAAPAVDDTSEPPPSIARVWNEEILAAIRIDLPHPPVHARNLFHLSAAMYDAWAAYDSVAVGYIYRGKHQSSDTVEARRQAISFAAFRLLTERYALSRNASTTLQKLEERMASLGYDSGVLSMDPSTPAGVGNRVAAAVSSFFLDDGALQMRAYQERPLAEGGYSPINPPLFTLSRGTRIINVNRWQPLALTNAVTQNELPADALQKFLGPQWLQVRPFALSRVDPERPWMDPGPPPRMGGAEDALFRENVVEVIRQSSQLTPDDGVTLDISPGGFGNNSLGFNDGTGHPLNPVTGFPYSPHIVKRGDLARVLAEYWADGPHSETPPGHWNTLANQVSDHPLFEKRFRGAGPRLEALEWDVKLYFALNAALHDAACAAWSLKKHYDGWRPISAIRFMGQLGQSSHPDQLWYDPSGLPLVPGLIEVVTTESSRAGGRHAGLPAGEIALFAWPGQPARPTTQYSGVRWILASEWLPYQPQGFVTPAFPGYVSGHSTFSRAAAEVLTAITGSPFFPGGLATHTAARGVYLTFEHGPSETVILHWATYFDAADQTGLSRVWGGIHPPADDLAGRWIGAQCGQLAWSMAAGYFDGSISRAPVVIALRPSSSGGCELHFRTLRGFSYQLQSTPDLLQPFADESGRVFQALDTSAVIFDDMDGSQGPQKFYRLMRH